MTHSSIQNYVKHLNHGIARTKINNYGQALEQFQASLVEYPIGYGAFLNIGHVRFSQESFQQAIKNYTIAVQCRPYLSMGYYSRFLIYLKNTDYKNALSNINSAISCESLKKFIETNNQDDLSKSIETASNNLQALIFRMVLNLKVNPQQANLDKLTINQLTNTYETSDFICSYQQKYFPTEIPFFQLKGSTQELEKQPQNVLKILKDKLSIYQNMVNAQNEIQGFKKSTSPKLNRWKSSQNMPILHNPFQLIKSKQKLCRNSSAVIDKNFQQNNYTRDKILTNTTLATNKKNSKQRTLKVPKQLEDIESFQDSKTKEQICCSDQFQPPELSFLTPTQMNQFKFGRSLKHCQACVKKKNLQKHPSIQAISFTTLIVSINSVLLCTEAKRKSQRFIRLILDGKILETDGDSNVGKQNYWHQVFQIQWQNKEDNNNYRVQLWESQNSKYQMIGQGEAQIKIGKLTLNLRIKGKYIGYCQINFKKQINK